MIYDSNDISLILLRAQKALYNIPINSNKRLIDQSDSSYDNQMLIIGLLYDVVYYNQLNRLSDSNYQIIASNLYSKVSAYNYGIPTPLFTPVSYGASPSVSVPPLITIVYVAAGGESSITDYRMVGKSVVFLSNDGFVYSITNLSPSNQVAQFVQNTGTINFDMLLQPSQRVIILLS